MEVEKSHGMPSANWRTRKLCGMIQFRFKGLRTSSDIPGHEYIDVLEQDKRETPLLPFCSIQALNGLYDAYPHG
jgi:hypothetical protein